MNSFCIPRFKLFLVVAIIVPAVLRTVTARAAETSLSDTQKAAHALNRLGYGPRPGEVERVAKLGVERWIEEQLHPEKLPDDDLAARLKPLATMEYSPAQLMLAYNLDQMKAIKKARQKLAEMMRQNREPAAKIQEATRPRDRTLSPELLALLTPRERDLLDEAQRNNIQSGDSVRAVGELQQERLIRAVHSQRQLQEVLVDFWSNHFNLDVKKGPVRVLKVVDEREVIRPHVLGRFRDLLGASAHSPAMMAYLDNARSTVERTISPRERERMEQRMQQRTQRRAALLPDATPNSATATGVTATGANQAADNAAPAAAPATADPAAAAEVPATRGGLNENYARELMELHTLGVDGGYTQQDVHEVARCFTGWGFDPRNGAFQFRPQQHDNGAKTVLGHKIAAGGGINDGEQVLDILAAHPATARHIARQLCMRFIADEPPASIVDKAAQTFTRTQGDLREVVRTIVTSPEFFSAAAYRAKIKSPFEYAVSAVRALGGEVNPDAATVNERRRAGRRGNGGVPTGPARARLLALADGASSVRANGNPARFKTLALEIAAMGQPLFSYQAPTGYPEDSQQWVSTGALIARLNYALALTTGEVQGVRLPPEAPGNTAVQPVAMQPASLLDQLLARLLDGEVSPGTRATLQAQAANAGAAKIAALIIGSPEFQRR
jgi:uncharacterized protein (DUF1800 family)